jgi:hypothetical protein
MARRPWLNELTPDSPTHLYIDMSGNIPDAEWIAVVADVVDRLKRVSEKLDQPLRLHLTAFSHELADDAVPIEVTAESPSDEELADHILKMPKADGGTDFSLVFDRINSNAARSERENFIVSDLEWWGRTEVLTVDHPEHLDYIAVERTDDAFKQRFITMLKGANLPEEHTVL